MRRMFIVGKDGFLVTTMRVALRYSSEIAVFGVRDSATGFARALRDARPDIVLLDGSASADRTLERLAQIAEDRPDAIVLVLATGLEAGTLEQLLASGATVCLSRSLTSGHLEALLADANERAAEEAPALPRLEVPAGPELALTPSAPAPASPPCPLTKRELEILRCVAEGHTNARIGRELWVTEQTVKFHLSNIYRKLGVSNRTEASRYVLLNDLFRTRQPETALPAVATQERAPVGHERINGHHDPRRNGALNSVR